MKVTFVESPQEMAVDSEAWQVLSSAIKAQQTDVLVLNEMPFGKWLAAQKEFDEQQAIASIQAHDEGVPLLSELDVPLVLSSRPVRGEHESGKMANEAFALVNGEYLAAHQKHFFPNEAGFYEPSWYEVKQKGFNVLKTEQLNVGFLLCTELMFNEWARFYGRQGAQLIAVPRATGQSYAHWKTAAAMAAIVSGCYVVSANRVGRYDDQQVFGGKGFAYAPDGSLISETSDQQPVVSFEMDLDFVKHQQSEYPCYVSDKHC